MSRYEEVEDCNKDPCVRLFFVGCFLLLPREKEKPDTQANQIMEVKAINLTACYLAQKLVCLQDIEEGKFDVVYALAESATVKVASHPK